MIKIKFTDKLKLLNDISSEIIKNKNSPLKKLLLGNMDLITNDVISEFIRSQIKKGKNSFLYSITNGVSIVEICKDMYSVDNVVAVDFSKNNNTVILRCLAQPNLDNIEIKITKDKNLDEKIRREINNKWGTNLTRKLEARLLAGI